MVLFHLKARAESRQDPTSYNFNIEGIDFKSHYNRTTQSNKSWQIHASKMTEIQREFLDPNVRGTTSKVSKQKIEQNIV